MVDHQHTLYQFQTWLTFCYQTIHYILYYCPLALGIWNKRSDKIQYSRKQKILEHYLTMFETINLKNKPYGKKICSIKAHIIMPLEWCCPHDIILQANIGSNSTIETHTRTMFMNVVLVSLLLNSSAIRGKCAYQEVRNVCFFGKFGVLCFLVTPVLKFTLLHYYQRIQTSQRSKETCQNECYSDFFLICSIWVSLTLVLRLESLFFNNFLSIFEHNLCF